jgi:hypothetical protein
MEYAPSQTFTKNIVSLDTGIYAVSFMANGYLLEDYVGTFPVKVTATLSIPAGDDVSYQINGNTVYTFSCHRFYYEDSRREAVLPFQYSHQP